MIFIPKKPFSSQKNFILFKNNCDIFKGYNDIGEVWQQEVDLPHLQETLDSLVQQIKPFYQLIHGVLRNVLWHRVNKFEPFKYESTIPAHMLGMPNIQKLKKKFF